VPREDAKSLKDNFARAEVTGTFALLIDEKNMARSYLLYGAVTYAGKTYGLKPKGMSLARAMTMLYGNYDPIRRVSLWRGDKHIPDENGGAEQPLGEALSATPIYSKQFRLEGTDKFLVVMETANEPGHASGAQLGVALYESKGAYWRLECGQKEVGEYGSWGKAPNPRLTFIGKNKPAVSLMWSDIGQGQEVGGITLLAKIDGAFSEVLDLTTREDTFGAGDSIPSLLHYKYDSQVDYLPVEGSEYYDLKVVSKGIRQVVVRNKKKFVPYSKTVVYRFRDGQYKVVGGASSNPL
jgi:hypothetical protein